MNDQKRSTNLPSEKVAEISALVLLYIWDHSDSTEDFKTWLEDITHKADRWGKTDHAKRLAGLI